LDFNARVQLQRFNISGGTRHDPRPSICVGRWQFVYTPSSKQLSVHSSLTHGYSRQFFFLQLLQWCRNASGRGSRPSSSSHPPLLDVVQAMRIAMIFALYPIFFRGWWRVYKGWEVVIGQGVTNGYLSPTLITGWR
jgi:hypothetical protein